MLLAHESDSAFPKGLSKAKYTHYITCNKPQLNSVSQSSRLQDLLSFPYAKRQWNLHNRLPTNTHGCTLADTHILKLLQLHTHFPFFWLPSSHQTPPSGRLTKWSCSGGMIYLLNRRIRFWEPPFFTGGWHHLPKSHKETGHHPDSKHSSCLWLRPAVLYDVFSNVVGTKCLS